MKRYDTTPEFEKSLARVLQKFEGNQARPTVQTIVETVDGRDFDSFIQFLGVINASVNHYVSSLCKTWQVVTMMICVF